MALIVLIGLFVLSVNGNSPSTATLTTHSDDQGVHSISNDGGASWTAIGTESSWSTAFSYDLTGVSRDTKIRVSVSDGGGIGGFIATVLFDGEQYSTTNPLQDGHWKLVSASDGETSLVYRAKTSSKWNINTAAIASDAFWVWNGRTGNTLVFEFDFDSVYPATTEPPSPVPTMEPTKNCDLLHIDEYLLDCSAEWDAAGNTRTAMQSSIDTNAADIVAATTSIASNAEDISTNAADIVAVKSTADSNAADVTAVESSVSALESRVKELEDILEQIGVNSAARSAVFQAVDDAKMVKGVSNGVTVTGKDLGIVALAAINVIMIVIMVIACKGSGRRTKYQPVAVGSDMEPINA